MTNEIEWIWESKLPNRLNISRDELRNLRTSVLKEGTDWRFEKKRVSVSLYGVEKLKVYLATAGAATMPLETKEEPIANFEKNAPEPAFTERLIDLCVWRANLPNRRIIEAHFPEKKPENQSQVVRVRVRDGSKFGRFDNTGKPMVIQCRHLQSDLYEHVGKTPKRLK